jgi:hypothetical protein
MALRAALQRAETRAVEDTDSRPWRDPVRRTELVLDDGDILAVVAGRDVDFTSVRSSRRQKPVITVMGTLGTAIVNTATVMCEDRG